MNPIEAEQICSTAEQALRHGSLRLSQFPGLLRRIIVNRLWERRQVPGIGVVELHGLRELVTTKPRRGWGEDPARLEAVIRHDPEVLTLWREAMKEPGRRSDLGHNVTGVQLKGNSRSYTLARLQKEAPELFELVKNGSMSANAAAIEAGFRVKTISVPLDPIRAAHTLKRYFEGDAMKQLLCLLTD